MADSDRIAPDGFLWVCCACGKTATDRYGPPGAMAGWDASCVINAQLFLKDKLVFGPGGRVVQVLD